MIRKALHFLAGALSEGPDCPSSKRVNFFLPIVGILVFCAYDVVKHGGVTREVIELGTTLLYVTGAAYGVTRVFAEKSDGPPAQPKT